MHGSAGCASDLERLGHDLSHRPSVQLVTVDDGDAIVSSPRRVVRRIGKVGDTDLHDAGSRQTRLDQPTHRRAIAHPLAQVVVRVERHQPGGADSRAPAAEGRGNRCRVVTPDGDDEL